MDIIHITNKGKMLNTMEKSYIYKETKNGSDCSHPKEYFSSSSFFSDAFSSLVMHRKHIGTNPKW